LTPNIPCLPGPADVSGRHVNRHHMLVDWWNMCWSVSHLNMEIQWMLSSGVGKAS